MSEQPSKQKLSADSSNLESRVRRLEQANEQARAARRAFRNGRMSVAIRHWSQAVKLDPFNCDYLNSLGRLYSEAGKLKKSQHCFQRVLVIDFYNAAALKGLGGVLFCNSEYSGAVYYYLRYLSQNARDAAAQAGLVSALSSAGKFMDAILSARRALRLFPKDHLLRFLLGSNYLSSGRIVNSIVHLRRACRLNPKNGEYHRALGNALASLGREHAALRSFKRAVVADPSNGAAFLDLAWALDHCNCNHEYLLAGKKALKIYRIQKDSNGAARAWWDIGWAFYKLGRLRESIQASRSAVRLDPKLTPPRFNLGLALLLTCQRRRAERQYRRALGFADPTSLKIDAIDDLEFALDKNPELPGGKEILAELKSRYNSGKFQLHAQRAFSLMATIPWPSDRLTPRPISPPGAIAPHHPLPRCDIVVIAWTNVEANALAAVLTPGFIAVPPEGKSERNCWFNYASRFKEYLPDLSAQSPALRAHSLGRYCITNLDKRNVLCFKSNLHFARDGIALSTKDLIKQIALETGARILITSGTAGAIGAELTLGDAVIATSVRFECKGQYKDAPFNRQTFSSGARLRSDSYLQIVNSTLIPANAHQLPHAHRTPKVFAGTKVFGEPNQIVTTDIFAYDDASNHFGLRGLGSLVEMNDALVALACEELGRQAPDWIAVRSVSATQAPNTQDAARLAKIYERYAYWASLSSALGSWAVILGS